ncbi:unnamed protein product [Durusdinium trenchii]|uniref:Subtilisin n=2 Tax=Durusdinium trenchii TaxID=1381693 RepID=A0ABP0SUI6_9DINO
MKDIELACFLQHFFEAGMGTDIGDVHAAASGTSIPTRCGSLVFVGNSHTYQPKELGGVPGAFARLAASCGHSVSAESVTQGGANLSDLWEEFESYMQRRGTEGVAFDTVVLQVGKGSAEERFIIGEVLRHRYCPLLLSLASNPQVVLYQTWSTAWPEPTEGEELTATLEEYRSVMLAAGMTEVVLARAGHAFLHLKADNRIYPALWKDDMGHGSALAGVLVAAVLALALKLTKGERLGRILEALLPSAWRTASPGFAGAAEFGQKAWREDGKGAPAAVMNLLNDPEEDLPISKYPPGMRTERRDLPFEFGDVLAAAAAGPLEISMAADLPRAGQGGYAAATSPAPKARRWQKR